MTKEEYFVSKQIQRYIYDPTVPFPQSFEEEQYIEFLADLVSEVTRLDRAKILDPEIKQNIMARIDHLNAVLLPRPEMITWNSDAKQNKVRLDYIRQTLSRQENEKHYLDYYHSQYLLRLHLEHIRPIREWDIEPLLPEIRKSISLDYLTIDNLLSKKVIDLRVIDTHYFLDSINVALKECPTLFDRETIARVRYMLTVYCHILSREIPGFFRIETLFPLSRNDELERRYDDERNQYRRSKELIKNLKKREK